MTKLFRENRVDLEMDRMINCTQCEKESAAGGGFAGQCSRCAMIAELIDELVRKQLREGAASQAATAQPA